MYADEQSVVDATNKIAKGVLKQFKNGHVEIPAALSEKFDKNNKNVTKQLLNAQAEFINKYNDLSAKGFSASTRELKEFVKLYDEYKQEISKSKQTGSKQNLAFRDSNLNQIFQDYHKQMNQLSKDVAKSVEKNGLTLSKKTKNLISLPKMSNSKSQKEYDKQLSKDLEAQARHIKNKRIRGVNRMGSTNPTGYPRGREYTLTEKDANLSEWGGAHASNMAHHQAVEDAKMKPIVAASLKVSDATVEDMQINGRKLSEQDNAKMNAQTAGRLSAKEITKIANDYSTADPDKFGLYVKGAMHYNKQAGKSDWDTMSLLTNMNMRKFDSTGKIGLGHGKIKGEGPNQKEANKELHGLMDTFTDIMSDETRKLKAYEAQQRKILAMLKDWKGLEKLDKQSSTKKIGPIDNSVLLRDLINIFGTNNALTANTNKAITDNIAATDEQLNYDKIEHTAERVSDRATATSDKKLIAIETENKNTGGDSDANFEPVKQNVNNINDTLDANLVKLADDLSKLMNPCEETLKSILSEVQGITKNGVKSKNSKSEKEKPIDPKALPTKVGEVLDVLRDKKTGLPLNQPVKTIYSAEEWAKNKKQLAEQMRILEEDSKRPGPKYAFPRSTITTTVKDPSSWFTKLKDIFAELTNTTANYKTILAATSEEQDKMNAERVKRYGLNRGSEPTDTGDKTAFARAKSLWKGKDKFKELFGNIDFSEGIQIDTTAISDRLAKVLSGHQMFKAQTGGWLRNLAGGITGGLAFAFQPSLEKTRAQADAINTIMANMREAVNKILQDILDKESKLSGMTEANGLQYKADGTIDFENSTGEAKTLLLQLEESKLALQQILADVGMVDEVTAKTHGRLSGITKQLGFTSTALRKNNAILANVNAGLDKNGKALKFQTRLQEILNYGFQLMSRHIGQMIKNWILMLNPINWIKKAFQDFMSYDAKWQRTMNVIKYNLRTILKPFMQWLAQQLVNVIGFIDIISMKVQEAFGHTPISLFDQAAADAEKIHEELEAGANVTAGFDELHDIGSDNTGANDLMGEIYKPQLSQEWIDLANQIGDLFSGLIKGDLGFGDVMKTIIDILWEGLKTIAKKIWDWFKQTAIGKWITENWDKLLGKLLTIFLGWKLLKTAGKLLWDALTGSLTPSAFSGIFSKLGKSFMDAFTSTQFGSDFVRGIKGIFTSGGMIGTIKSGAASLGTIFAQGLVAATGIAIGVTGIAVGYDMVADDESYNLGLEEAGGNEKDKKSGVGGRVVGTVLGGIGGGIAAGAIAGASAGPIGILVGAVSGLLITSLAPAFEKVEVASRNANNEMQKIEYYEGKVQGCKTQVEKLTEQENLLKESLKLSTDKIYEQGEKLGISKTRMDELVKSTQDGTFETDNLRGAEVQLADSLTNLTEKQKHATEVTNKLKDAQLKLQKAEEDAAIAKDIEAGKYEVAAAKIEVAEAKGVYTVEEATKKRIQLYKETAKEERENLLQDLTPGERAKMLKYRSVSAEEMGKLGKIWNEMSQTERDSLLKGIDETTQNEFKRRMNHMSDTIKEHQGFWQSLGDTIKEIFSLGIADTWTYNGEKMYYKEGYEADYYNERTKKREEHTKQVQDLTNEMTSVMQNPNISNEEKGKLVREYRKRLDDLKAQQYAIGTNYVPMDGLAYLHQGEAVIPAKYNKPYSNDNSNLENAINDLSKQVSQINNQMNKGIPVTGQFVQKGTDLVATVQRVNNQLSNNILNNKVYAR